MMDAAFLAALAAWAEQFAGAFAERSGLARDAGDHQAAETADLAAGALGELRALLDARLAGERARLAAAVEEARTAERQANVRMDQADDQIMRASSARTADFLRAQSEDARAARDRARGAGEMAERALAAFDRAARGAGELRRDAPDRPPGA